MNRASRSDKEDRKFEKNNQNEWAVRTKSEIYGSNGSVIGDSNPFPVLNYSQLIPKKYDYIDLTYVASGNGAGKIETATYKVGGVSGTTVAVLTLTYNSDNKIASVTRT